jgi:hypothetical protein
MASTLRPEESRVQIEKSLRAADAAAGVRSPPTEHRTTAFEPIEEAVIAIVRRDEALSSVAPVTEIGMFLFTKHVTPERPEPEVEKPSNFPATKEVTEAALEYPRNSKINFVWLFFRYWDNKTEADDSGPYIVP